MTEKTLKRANDLAMEMKALLEELSYWKESINIKSIRLVNSNGVATTLESSYMDFQLLRVLVIKNLTEKFEAVKTEFEKL